MERAEATLLGRLGVLPRRLVARLSHVCELVSKATLAALAGAVLVIVLFAEVHANDPRKGDSARV